MTLQEKNKQFYCNYIASVTGKPKPHELLIQFIEDEKLIEHVLFFEKLFPEYQIIIDDLMAEGNWIFVRAHIIGKHEGEADGIPITHKNVEAPFALGYEIKNEKIMDFWAIGNELELFEQMGLAREQVEVKKIKEPGID